MLMKIKNKMTLAMDKMIEKAEADGGIPSHILLDPQEAANFLRELSTLKVEYRRFINLLRTNDNTDSDTDMRFILYQKMSTENLKTIINQLYKNELSLSYKNIKIQVIKKHKFENPGQQSY